MGVVACNIIPVDIHARISINSMASQDINVTKSWIIANLFVAGVENIELVKPREDIVVKGSEYAMLKNLKVELQND